MSREIQNWRGVKGCQTCPLQGYDQGTVVCQHPESPPPKGSIGTHLVECFDCEVGSPCTEHPTGWKPAPDACPLRTETLTLEWDGTR